MIKKIWEIDSLEKLARMELHGTLSKLGMTDQNIKEAQENLENGETYIFTLSDDKRNELEERMTPKTFTAKEINNDTETDMKRALKLANLINSTDFNASTKDLKTVKSYTSQSKWYENEGFGHMRSTYNECVPAELFEAAKELRSIRKKHQGNEKFNFDTTDYKTVTISDTDH